MSFLIGLGLKLLLPIILGGGGGHLLGGLIVSRLAAAGVPKALLDMAPDLLKGLSALVKHVDMKKVDELPVEQQNAVRQIEAAVRRNTGVFDRF